MPLILIKRETPGITEIVLNRPEKRNALNIEMLMGLCQILEEVKNDPSQRVVILRGDGPVFCAGLDLKEADDPNTRVDAMHRIGQTIEKLYHLPRATIAMVHGAALAGGGGLVAACDFAVAEESTRFGFPEIRRGLVPAQVIALLVHQLRVKDIKELMLFGDIIDAKKALSIGLINSIVKKSNLHEAAYAQAQLAIKGSPKALMHTKKLIEDLLHLSFIQGMKQALDVHNRTRESDEAKEGIAAFFEKREPNWTEVL